MTRGIEVSDRFGGPTRYVDKNDIPFGYHTPQEWSDIYSGKVGNVKSGPSIPSGSSADDYDQARHVVDPGVINGLNRVEKLREPYVRAAVSGENVELTKKQEEIANAVRKQLPRPAQHKLPIESMPESEAGHVITSAVASLRNQAHRIFGPWRSEAEIKKEEEKSIQAANLDFSKDIKGKLTKEQLKRIGDAELY